MATVREKGPYQWQVQIRRKGWPKQSATCRTKKEAQAWARQTESEMDRGLFVDQSGGRRTTLADLIELYLREVTANRPGADSRIAESNRLKRWLRPDQFGFVPGFVSSLNAFPSVECLHDLSPVSMKEGDRAVSGEAASGQKREVNPDGTFD
jgi:hypothetical protein